MSGVSAHDTAVAVGIKVPDGQPLHVGEHIAPDGVQGALGDVYHQPAEGKGCQDTGCIDSHHGGQGTVQARRNPGCPVASMGVI